MTPRELTCEAVARAALGEPAKCQGHEILWRCPRHVDEHPSLSINPGRNLWMCGPCGASGTAWQLAAFLAGVTPSDKPGVTAWLRERGLLRRRERGPKTERGACIARYTYTDAAGNPIARKLRFEPGADGRKKDFAWERFESSAWKSGLAGVQLPLYRLREIAGERFVILTEGEKDCDAGARLGLATTTSGGVNSFRLDHAEMLRGKSAVIVADADEPGRQHAQKVAGMLSGNAASVKVLEIPGAKDLAEAIEGGWTCERLLALFDAAPGWRQVDGAAVLDAVFRFLRRFVSLSEPQARVVSLWIAHTHALQATETTPYLAITSAEKQSGKTRLLEVLRLLVREPWLTGRCTAAVLIRKIDAVSPTLLLDESDAAFNGTEDYSETLRGILNTGYRRGGVASLCVGQGAAIEFRDFSTFCPKAIAGIGKLPDTIADRSIPVRLKRAQRGRVERFRERDAEHEASDIRASLAAWCGSSLQRLRGARPEIPAALSDRHADCCEPLLAVADLAGGDWPQAARTALVDLCGQGQAEDDSIGVRLLADTRAIFEEKKTDRLASEDLAAALAGIETSPWAEWNHGKPISKQKLARLLKPFGVVPRSVRLPDGSTPKGYLLADFEELFSSYLPAPPEEKRHNATSHINAEEKVDFQNATNNPCDDHKKREVANAGAACGAVAFPKPGNSSQRATRMGRSGHRDPVEKAVGGLLKPGEHLDERGVVRRVQ